MENKYYGCVYKTINLINGKMYVGQTRYPERVENQTYKGSGKLILRAFNKYGFQNFKSEILSYARDCNEIDELEISNIRDLNTGVPSGYNIAEGGNKGGHLLKHATAEMKKEYCSKISIALRGKTPWNKGKRMPEHIGKIVSEANKKQTGVNSKMFGKSHSRESKDKISKGNTGKVRSTEQKEKYSKSLLGHNVSQITREKLRNHFLGLTKSEDKKNPIITCPHCNKSGRNNVMPRYHFNNCKHKNNEIKI